MDNDINFKLVHESKGSANYSIEYNTYTLYYPCTSTHDCTPYTTTLPKGTYYIELYGASGSSSEPSTACRLEDNTHIDETIVKFYRGNAEMNNISSNAGSGGYTSGLLTLTKPTTVFISIGGIGEKISTDQGKTVNNNEEEIAYVENINNRPRGGYNGGGSGIFGQEGYAGGGATDFRAEVNDLFHRILVAGGGGGADNNFGPYESLDDGSGGAGGGLIAQGFWKDGQYVNTYIATQLSGFSFGNGEAAFVKGSHHKNGVKVPEIPIYGTDIAGAGGGWFGGFSGQDANSGGGGGSSFALTKDAVFPKGVIDVYNEFYELETSGRYAFQHKEYIIEKPIFVRGIWSGSGMARITHLSEYDTKYQLCTIFRCKSINKVFTFVSFIFCS